MGRGSDLVGARSPRRSAARRGALEKPVTSGAGGRILTHSGVWSPDSQWIVYDTRSDAAGAVFDGTRIEMVHVETGEVRCVYESQRGAHCGVATFHPTEAKVVFILGPEDPTPDWQYGPAHRQGVIVDTARPGAATPLDARDLTPPFTPGALRGGSHVHVFSPDGAWVSFTYNDHVLSAFPEATAENDVDQRNVGISVPAGAVSVRNDHPRNHDGTYFTALATRTSAHPAPGSDAIRRACEEGWVGANGYRRRDGAWQRRALAFQGEVIGRSGAALSEVFVVDLPSDVTRAPDDGPLEGTACRRPLPPRGTQQRRLTFTEDRLYPGIQGPRHWLRSSPDGTRIGFLMRDDAGAAQFWTISPNGGPPRPVTRDPWGVASAFTWSPDGAHIAYAADNSVFVTESATGRSRRLTPRSRDADAPLPLACVFSPDGCQIAYQRRVAGGGERCNQIFVVSGEPEE